MRTRDTGIPALVEPPPQRQESLSRGSSFDSGSTIGLGARVGRWPLPQDEQLSPAETNLVILVEFGVGRTIHRWNYNPSPKEKYYEIHGDNDPRRISTRQ